MKGFSKTTKPMCAADGWTACPEPLYSGREGIWHQALSVRRGIASFQVTRKRKIPPIWLVARYVTAKIQTGTGGRWQRFNNLVRDANKTHMERGVKSHWDNSRKFPYQFSLFILESL